uniref:B1496_F1_41 n=1 Tax=Mycobacterium leprae TaxID=1769 RepID=Q49701_MYCLR|nr:B1496_F1_41 [Mycobacterium leprae]
MIQVHLPVAGDERLAAHESPPLGCSRPSTSIPGSVLPSRYSNDAPPPVERCETLPSGRLSARIAAAESPPPTTLKAPLPVTATIASATPLVPAAYAGNSNTPIGPFQKMVEALDNNVANRLTDSGPISSPINPSGIASAATVCGGESATNFSVTTMSIGSRSTSA